MKYLLTILLLVGTVVAEEEDSCATPCPEGKEQVTFGDGNNARCTCVDPRTEMEDGPSGCDGGESCNDSYVHEEE